MKESYCSSFFRGGGCGASKQRLSEKQDNSQLIPLTIIQNFRTHFKRINSATHPEQVMNSCQFFKIHERYLQFMINNKDECIAYRKMIFDQFVMMIDKIFHFITLKSKQSIQCAYYLCELTTKCCNILFVYHYYFEKDRMPVKEHQELCLKIEKIQGLVDSNDIELYYKNSLQYELGITHQLINFIPIQSQEPIAAIKKIVVASGTSISKGIIDPSLIEALAEGAKILYQEYKQNKLESKFKIIYTLNEVQWKIIEQIERCDSINIIIQTLVDIYLKIKNITDWDIMFTWVKVISALYNYSPTIQKEMLSIEELKKFQSKKYLFYIGHNLYQTCFTYEQLKQDETAFELLSKIQCQQHMAQLQNFILTGNDKLPSFENYYLKLDITEKKDEPEKDDFLELLFNQMKLAEVIDFMKEIDNDIVELQQMIEVTITQANSIKSVQPQYTKIQFFLNSLLAKLFNFSLIEGYIENIQNILDQLFNTPNNYDSLGKDIELKKFKSNVLQVETGIMITDIIKGMYRFKKNMNEEENGQTKTLKAEYLKQIKSRDLKIDKQILEFKFFGESEFKDSWKKLGVDNLTVESIINIQKEIKSTILTEYGIKEAKQMNEFIQYFNKVSEDFRHFYQIHLFNLSTLLKINYQIEQQIYQVDTSQNTEHQINIHIDLIWQSKQLLKYNTWFLILRDLKRLKSSLQSIRSQEQKKKDQNLIYPNIQSYIVKQIIEKIKSTAQFKINKFQQYFASEYRQILDAIQNQEQILDFGSYFDVLRAIVYLISQCLSDYKTQFKQLTEYTKMLASAKEVKDEQNDSIEEPDYEYEQLIKNLIEKTNNINVEKLEKRDVQPILNKLSQFYDYQHNQNQKIESKIIVLESVRKVHSMLKIIIDLNFEDATEYEGAKVLFKEIQIITKEQIEKNHQSHKLNVNLYFNPQNTQGVFGIPQVRTQLSGSPTISPRGRISHKPTQLDEDQASLLDLQNIKVSNLEKLLYQIKESFTSIRRKNQVFLNFRDTLSVENYKQMLKQRNFSSELKVLQRFITFSIGEIDSSSFVEKYKKFQLIDNQKQNVKFINLQLFNSVLNMFADKPQSKFQKYKQQFMDLFKDNWRVRQIAAMELLSMKSKSINKPIYEQAAKVVLRFYAFETDSRVRAILERPEESNFLNNLFSQYWQSEEEWIQDKIKEQIKDINNLGFELQSTGDMDKRKILQFQIQEKQKQIDEILKNVGSIGQALGITILFIQDLKQDLQRIQSKLNEMNDSLQIIQADIRYLRGKTVQQLLELRMNKVLQNQLIVNYKSVYVQLKTKELIEGQELEDSHLYTNDIFGDGEVNEFLWKQDKESMLIHGQAGSGKSTAARKIEEFLWMFYKKNSNISEKIPLIPIMINLPSIKNVKENAIEEALKSDYYRFDNKQIQELKEAVEEGKYRLVIIFDAYDELHHSIIGINLNFTNHVNRWRQSKDAGKYPKVITTSRSEIFNISYYSSWFMSDSKNADITFKEVKLQKFDKGQVNEYLNQFTKLGIKKTLFEYYQPLVKSNNEIDQLEQFEQLWGQMQIGEHNFAFLSGDTNDGVTDQEIQQILGIMKSDKNIEMFSQEVERSLTAELRMLWPTSVYLNCIDVMNLYDLLETPFMMEIVVQVLPIIIKKKSEPSQLQENFVNNYVSLQKFEMQRDEAIDKARDYWKQIQNSQNFFNQFQITLSPSRIQEILIKEFPSFSEECVILAQALQNQELIQYDYYEYFFQMYFEKQIRKLQDNGQAYDYVVLLNEIKQFSTQLAIKMTLEQKTQIEYKSHGLLYGANLQKEWTDSFFDDTEDKLGQIKKMYRSCLPLKQKSCFYSFNHKSLQEFLVAQDFVKFIQQFENNKQTDSKEQAQQDKIQQEKQNIDSKMRTLEEQAINQTSFSNEFYFGISNFISQKFCKNLISKQILIEIIKKTSENKKIIVAGSNCFYFLSKMGAYLGGQNFNKIIIENVDLSESILFNADLSYSKFNNVNISNINLNQANLTGARWENIKINELPNLDKQDGYIQNIATITESHIIAITQYGKIMLYEMNQNSIELQNLKINVAFSEITATHVFVAFENGQQLLYKINQYKLYQQNFQSNEKFSKFKQISENQFIVVNQQKSMQIYNYQTQKFQQLTKFTDIQCIFTSLQRNEVGYIYLDNHSDQNPIIEIFNLNKNNYQKLFKEKSKQKFEIKDSQGIYIPNTSKIAIYYEFQIQIYDINKDFLMENSISLQSQDSKVNFKQLLSSYDGTQLLTLKDNLIQVWNTNSLSKVGQPFKPKQQVEVIALLQKSSLILTGSSDGTINLWDIQSANSNQQSSNLDKQKIQVSLFNKDASQLFVAIKKKIQIWNLISKVFLVKELKGHDGEIVCMNISPNQQKLSGGVQEEGAIYIWSLSNCELKHKIQTYQFYSVDLQWFDDNFLASLENSTIVVKQNNPNSILKILDLKDRSIKVIREKDQSYAMHDTIQSYSSAQQIDQTRIDLIRTDTLSQFYFCREKHLLEVKEETFDVKSNIFYKQQVTQDIKIPISLKDSMYLVGKYKRTFVIYQKQEQKIHWYFYKQDNEKNKTVMDLNRQYQEEFKEEVKCMKLVLSDTILFIGGKNIHEFKIIKVIENYKEVEKIKEIKKFERNSNDQNNELISHIALSANMEFLYGACQSGIIYKWNYRARRLLDIQIKAQQDILALYFSHNLLILISISKQAIQFWTQQDKELEPENSRDNYHYTCKEFGYSALPYNKQILAVAAIKKNIDSFAILLIDIERRLKINEIQMLQEIPKYFCFLSTQLTIIVKQKIDQKFYQLVQQIIFQYKFRYPLSILNQFVSQNKDKNTSTNCISVFKDYIAISFDDGRISYENRHASELRFTNTVDTKSKIKCLTHSKDGQYLFSGNDSNIQKWKLENRNGKKIISEMLESIPYAQTWIQQLIPFDDKILIIKGQQSDPQYVKFSSDKQFAPLASGNKQVSCITTDEDSIIILYDYLLLKRWRLQKNQNGKQTIESFICSQTYGEKQGIECENVNYKSCQIKSYLGIDLTKLFHSAKK